MNYVHTQRSPEWVLLTAINIAALTSIWMALDRGPTALIIGCCGLGLAVLALCMTSLTVTDVGDSLAIQFGPIPIFRIRIRYSSITHAEPSRTAPIDGWGIHYIPGRGWTYNIWGRPCVCLTVNRRTIRIGSDDADNLAKFVRARIGA